MVNFRPGELEALMWYGTRSDTLEETASSYRELDPARNPQAANEARKDMEEVRQNLEIILDIEGTAFDAAFAPNSEIARGAIGDSLTEYLALRTRLANRWLGEKGVDRFDKIAWFEGNRDGLEASAAGYEGLEIKESDEDLNPEFADAIKKVNVVRADLDVLLDIPRKAFEVIFEEETQSYIQDMAERFSEVRAGLAIRWYEDHVKLGRSRVVEYGGINPADAGAGAEVIERVEVIRTVFGVLLETPPEILALHVGSAQANHGYIGGLLADYRNVCKKFEKRPEKRRPWGSGTMAGRHKIE